jgi:hypothetical protein
VDDFVGRIMAAEAISSKWRALQLRRAGYESPAAGMGITNAEFNALVG